MSPVPRLPILSSLSRTRIPLQPSRFQAPARLVSSAVPKATGGQAAWSAHWKKSGNVAMMYTPLLCSKPLIPLYSPPAQWYFPVVGVVMFWPYVVPPVMDYFEGGL
ncbi:unnamed protein product [Diplocarpon coronariae]|nr:hypothetical protein JHW43_004565 [Diplocarpon mali]